ncbi:hypothetical protein M885DRAFT_559543 [Pelagophyceae sp. CCMP2097]|nr:hypothetical protein M885DRAFT_559543 [Pelagophyceae sp. CCMP2097]
MELEEAAAGKDRSGSVSFDEDDTEASFIDVLPLDAIGAESDESDEEEEEDAGTPAERGDRERAAVVAFEAQRRASFEAEVSTSDAEVKRLAFALRRACRGADGLRDVVTHKMRAEAYYAEALEAHGDADALRRRLAAASRNSALEFAAVSAAFDAFFRDEGLLSVEARFDERAAALLRGALRGAAAAERSFEDVARGALDDAWFADATYRVDVHGLHATWDAASDKLRRLFRDARETVANWHALERRALEALAKDRPADTADAAPPAPEAPAPPAPLAAPDAAAPGLGDGDALATPLESPLVLFRGLARLGEAGRSLVVLTVDAFCHFYDGVPPNVVDVEDAFAAAAVNAESEPPTLRLPSLSVDARALRCDAGGPPTELRLVAQDRRHLTLHFDDEADAQRLRALFEAQPGAEPALQTSV